MSIDGGHKRHAARSKLPGFIQASGLTLSAVALVVGLMLIYSAESIDFVSGEGGGAIGLLMQWVVYIPMIFVGIFSAIAGGVCLVILLLRSSKQKAEDQGFTSASPGYLYIS